MYLIEKKDIRENKTEIVGNTPILKSDALMYFNKIFEKIQLEDEKNILKMVYDQTKNSCDIFIEQELINKGWVWNSIELVKKTLFKLSLVELNETFLDTKVINNKNNYNYGYASHCFSPEWKTQFVEELKYKLTLPKYGLENTFN